MISEDAVVFFGHFSIEGSEASFYMRYRNMKFYCCKRTGEGGIGVTIDKNTIRFFFDQDFFDLLQHAAGHGSVGCAVDAEVVVLAAQVERELGRAFGDDGGEDPGVVGYAYSQRR